MLPHGEAGGTRLFAREPLAEAPPLGGAIAAPGSGRIAVVASDDKRDGREVAGLLSPCTAIGVAPPLGGIVPSTF